MMYAARTSETSVYLYQTTRRNPEDSLHTLFVNRPTDGRSLETLRGEQRAAVQ
jgi:hypothetical protein